MIRILTKKAFRFTRPGEGSIGKPKPGETHEEASQRVMRDAATALSNASQIAKHKEHYCDVQPGIVTDCPDWIRLDEIFEWGVKDDDIMELVAKTSTPSKKEQAAAAAGEVLATEGDVEVSDDEEAEEAKDEEPAADSDTPKDEDGNLGGVVKAGTLGGPVQRRRVMGNRRS